MAEESLGLVASGDQKIVGPIAEKVLAHLEDETKSLAAMLEAVREVHNALLVLNDEALKSSLEAESRQLQSSAAVQQRRHELQNHLATVFHMAPEQVTLKHLASMASGTIRESIDRAWQALVEMAAEADRLNRQNAAMITQSLSIARGVFERLTKAKAYGDSYNAVGGRADTYVGPLIQWGG